MLFTRPTTLFFIGRDRLVRADFAAGRRGPPIAIAQRMRPDSDDPAVTVATLAAAGGARLGRVFILSVDCWVHTMDLVTSILGGMNDEEMTKLLSFDAEPLSGINAFDAASAMLPVGNNGTEKRFWFSEVSQSTREQFDAAIRQAGGTLAGICHPGGVPMPLTSPVGDKTWRRVEFWPGTVVRAAYHGTTLMHLEVDEGQSPQDKEAILRAWRVKTGASEIEEVLFSEAQRDSRSSAGATSASLPDDIAELDRAGLVLLDEGNAEQVSLLDEIALGEWLAHWHRVLTARRPAAPVIRMERRPMTGGQRRLVAAGLAGVVALACFGHFQWVKWALAQTADEQTRVEAPGKELAQVTKQAGDLEKEIQKLRDETGKLEANVQQCEKVLEVQRSRLSDLIGRLAKMPQQGWVLRQIGGDAREVTLQGITMHPQRISALSSELSAELHDLGWGVEPPKQTAQNFDQTGGPWKFEVRLRDVAIATPPVPATPPGRPAAGGPTVAQAAGSKPASEPLRPVTTPPAESERR
jgi:cell division protein FtsB